MIILEYLIELKNISKQFPGVKALDNVSFSLSQGEVHALLGENGAGKSTLVKIICGVCDRDEGKYRIRGVNIGNLSPKTALQHGIAIIHQELNLCQDLTVAENIFLGRETTKAGVIKTQELNRAAKSIIAKLKVDIEPDIVMKKLPVSKQQLVEIAKALSTNAQILIMDEPTSALTEKEVVELFGVINSLKKNGCAIIYISHRLEELERIADRITILRDGKHIVTKDYKDSSLNEIISYMVGREIKEKFPSLKMPVGKKIMEVKNLYSDSVHNVSFDLYEGEILGFAGLVGAGRTELLKALFGADTVISGEIRLHDKKININSPQDAIKQGIVLGPEDRKKEGLCTKLSIRENVGLANMDKICNHVGIVKTKIEQDLVHDVVRKLKVSTPSIEQIAGNLSGGNQQKIVVGKWLARDAKVMMFDEPTKGIDVGAKVEIYNIMNDLKRQGIGVLFVSSEIPEVMGMSDRVLVMCEGRITGNLSAKESTQDEILRLATKYSG